MDRINKIIREEIERYILSEAIDFTTLNNLANQLRQSLSGISNASSDTSYDQRLRQYFTNFITYCVQIIAAINRCNQAQTLNEVQWGGLSNYGINLPRELGGNLWQDAKRGYYGTKNWVLRKQGKGGNNNTNNSYGNGQVNGKTVPTVKLSVLLSQIRAKQNEYAQYNSQFNIVNNNPQLDMEFHKILGNGGIIPQIYSEYQKLVNTTNAQGNP